MAGFFVYGDCQSLELILSLGMPKTKRVDQAVVELGLCESREKARRAVLAGQVRINGHPARKPSDPVKTGDRVELAASEKYVSRGGLKLEQALNDFKLPLNGAVAVDVGASTGGFTDCLLQHGVSKVYAIDVGQGQLAWKLRQDPRVVVMEKTNARYLAPDRMPSPFEPVDLGVVDCSFISLRTILPAIMTLIKPGGHCIALVKPQFEAGKREVDRGGGVIRDHRIHRKVIDDLKAFIESETSLRWRNLIDSPITGPAGNKEFLVLLEKENERLQTIRPGCQS